MRNPLLEVTPVIPPNLARLPEMAGNLFLRCVPQSTLDRVANDSVYLARYKHASDTLDEYLNARAPTADQPLIAYFCAEYGFHESFPIYSGGLGVLAGDYCKAASDDRANFIAVGLLYGQGYFTQSVDNDGVQHAQYRDRSPRDLPVEPARGRRSGCSLAPVEGAGGSRSGVPPRHQPPGERSLRP
jgi:glycogen phosphorylase